MHGQQAINAVNQKGLKETYTKLVGTKKECTSKLEEAWLSLETSQGKKEEDSAQAKAFTAPRMCTTRLKCHFVGCKPCVLAVLQPPFRRSKTVLEQDPG
jgi:hypothetical protein